VYVASGYGALLRKYELTNVADGRGSLLMYFEFKRLQLSGRRWNKVPESYRGEHAGGRNNSNLQQEAAQISRDSPGVRGVFDVVRDKLPRLDHEAKQKDLHKVFTSPTFPQSCAVSLASLLDQQHIDHDQRRFRHQKQLSEVSGSACRWSLTSTLSHSHTNITFTKHSLLQSLTLNFSHAHFNTLTHAHSRLTLTLSRTLSLSTHTSTLTHNHSHSHDTGTLALHNHTPTHSLSIPLTLSHTHTYTQSLSRS
jgi:hypothetical protein